MGFALLAKRHFAVVALCCLVASVAKAEPGLAPAQPPARGTIPAGQVVRLRPIVASDSKDAKGADGLMSDLVRIVQAEEVGGWVIDEVEYETLHPALMDSVCRASVPARRAVLARTRRATERAGDPKRLFEMTRELTSEVEWALTLSRRHEAMRRALASVAECPFWLLPEYGFLGRQSDRHRFTLSIETGGNLQFRQTAGAWTFGGGGLGRILPSYGFGEHWTGLLGVEFGGGAMLRPGGPETEFVINYFPAIPLVLRYRTIDWHYDVEMGPVALFQADNTRLSYGARIGFAFGVFSLRTLSVLPWAGFAMTYERYFENSARPAAHFIRSGLRVGIVWDP